MSYVNEALELIEKELAKKDLEFKDIEVGFFGGDVEIDLESEDSRGRIVEAVKFLEEDGDYHDPIVDMYIGRGFLREYLAIVCECNFGTYAYHLSWTPVVEED